MLSTLILIKPNFCFSQHVYDEQAANYLATRGEVYLRFVCDKSGLEQLSRIISIDRIKNDTVFAYANKQQFRSFLETNHAYTILTPPSLLLDDSDIITGILSKDWDVYPTYNAYITLMNDFAANYPGLCKLYEIGTSVNGRELLCVKLSDNVGSKEPEPEFLFSSTMHGDEVTGYVLLLRLIDYLLTNYETQPEVKRLVDSIEIWINPNANPDGTYYSGDHTVIGAIRENANFVDLNRNFPDPDDGAHPDGNLWQPETEAMMQFMGEHNFVFSANYHGGAEVMNYPWDTWSRPHPDEEWFEYVSHCYADTVKKYGGSSYFSDVVSDGVINGYDWYTIAGGRQDYTTYFCYGREITIEVSEIKMPAAVTLPTYWDYNYKAMLDYMGQCLNGIHGVVTDSITGAPLVARIFVVDHDADSSQVYSDSVNGDYHRLIGPGTYDILCAAPGYLDKIEYGVVVDQYTSSQTLNFELNPGTNPPEILVQPESNKPECWFDTNGTIHVQLQEPQHVSIYLYTVQGTLIYSTSLYAPEGQSNIIFGSENYKRNLYFCRIMFENGDSETLKVQFF